MEEEEGNRLLRTSSQSSLSEGSSSTMNDWILLNTTGSEIENCSSQTEPLDLEYGNKGSVDSARTTNSQQKEAALRESYSSGSSDVESLKCGNTEERECQSDSDRDNSYYCDDLPTNFVQICSSRIRNYIHTTNVHLNWKLSFLLIVVTATTIGLGLGHFVGSTHLWLKKQKEVDGQPVKNLKTLEDDLTACLQKLKSSQESDTLKKSRVDWAFNHIRHLEDNLTLVSWKASLYPVAVLAQLSSERRGLLLQKRLEKKDARIEVLKEKLVEIRSEILGLAVGNAGLKEENEVLIMKNEKLQQQLLAYELKEEKQKQWGQSSEAFSWNMLFEKLKNASNVTETVKAYLAILNSFDLSQLAETTNGTNHYLFDDQWHQLQELLENTRNLLSRKFKDLTEIAEQTNLEQYFDGAEVLAQRIITALNQLWEKTKGVADTVSKDQGKQVENYLNYFNEQLSEAGKRIAEDLSPKIQESWSVLSRNLQNILSAGGKGGRTERDTWTSASKDLEEVSKEEKDAVISVEYKSSDDIEEEEEVKGKGGIGQPEKQTHENEEGSWLFKRSSGRKAMREKEKRADWVFDRSRDRSRLRKEQEDGYKQSEWLFRRGKERAKRRKDGDYDGQHRDFKQKKRREKSFNCHDGHSRKKWKTREKHGTYQHNTQGDFFGDGGFFDFFGFD